MNKEEFYNTDPNVRVDIINEMLKTRSLKEVAKAIGVPESSFSKEMTNGDYVYIKRDNQYYKFVRGKSMIMSKQSEPSSDAILFIEENLETLPKIIADYERDKKTLILNERVYSKKAEYTNKSIKMNSDIYNEFVEFCKDNYPYLAIQDLVAQSLLDFITQYKKK